MPEPAKPEANTLNVALDSGVGPTVVLVHGIASSWVTFTNLIPLLREHHRLIAVDLLGFGKSIPNDRGSFSLDEHVDALARTLSGLGLEAGFTLVGHSLGALIAVRYAATWATTADRLVLLGPPIYPAPELLARPADRAAEAARLTAYRLLRQNKDAAIDLAQGLGRLSPILGVLDLSERNWNAFELSLANAIETQSTIEDIGAIELPIDILVGNLDPFVLPAGIRLAEQYSNVTVHRIDGVDHLIRPRMATVAAALIDGLR